MRSVARKYVSGRIHKLQIRRTNAHFCRSLSVDPFASESVTVIETDAITLSATRSVRGGVINTRPPPTSIPFLDSPQPARARREREGDVYFQKGATKDYREGS